MVAVALVPEAIAFSFIAGVNPIVGLYTAFILGIITSLIGGKPGMISGAMGTGNITCGFFGGMAGCAMIGQSIINYTSGGGNRTALIFCSGARAYYLSRIYERHFKHHPCCGVSWNNVYG